MLIKLEKPSTLSRAIEIISELVQEVRIKSSEYGLSISAMDPANVAMVGFKIPKSAFTKFEAKEETIGVNLENLKKVLKRTSPKSILTIETKENFIELQIDDRVKRNFRLGLIEVESEDIEFDTKISRMEFVTKVECASKDFIDAIEDCSVISDACTFIVEDQKFTIESKGLNSASSEFSGDEAFINGENAKARYSLDYLQKFTKASKLCEKTKIKFADEHPLKLEFKLPDMELNFVLAPRVETED